MRRIAGLLLIAASAAVAADTIRTQAAGLRFSLPAAWVRVPAPSDMRAAQYRLPKAGDAGDGELVLFFFGPGKGGSKDANLDRWYGQFTQPDGRPSRDAATVATRKVHGLDVTTVDLSGAYSGMSPHEKAQGDTRMLAAIVEGEGGPWFFKAIGPSATMAAAKPGFDAMIDSLEVHH
jgi:hypothetical protein